MPLLPDAVFLFPWQLRRPGFATSFSWIYFLCSVPAPETICQVSLEGFLFPVANHPLRPILTDEGTLFIPHLRENTSIQCWVQMPLLQWMAGPLTPLHPPGNRAALSMSRYNLVSCDPCYLQHASLLVGRSSRGYRFYHCHLEAGWHIS